MKEKSFEIRPMVGIGIVLTILGVRVGAVIAFYLFR